MGQHMQESNQSLGTQVNPSTVLCLSREEITSLCVKHNDVSFHLIEGRAWVTYDDSDVIVESGETISIPTSKHRIIISSANKYKTICYQIA